MSVKCMFINPDAQKVCGALRGAVCSWKFVEERGLIKVSCIISVLSIFKVELVAL